MTHRMQYGREQRNLPLIKDGATTQTIPFKVSPTGGKRHIKSVICVGESV